MRTFPHLPRMLAQSKHELAGVHVNNIRLSRNMAGSEDLPYNLLLVMTYFQYTRLYIVICQIYLLASSRTRPILNTPTYIRNFYNFMLVSTRNNLNMGNIYYISSSYYYHQPERHTHVQFLKRTFVHVVSRSQYGSYDFSATNYPGNGSWDWREKESNFETTQPNVSIRAL